MPEPTEVEIWKEILAFIGDKLTHQHAWDFSNDRCEKCKVVDGIRAHIEAAEKKAGEGTSR